MTIIAVLVIVLGLMLVEALLSRRNEQALRQRGASEPQGDVYAVMQVVYPAAFLVPALEGSLRAEVPAWWWTTGLALFVVAKALKYWAIASLGERWTFKVLVPPGSERTRRGPYRIMDHPNYVAVGGEILGAGLLMGGPWSGIIFTVVFTSLMLRRVQVEKRALS